MYDLFEHRHRFSVWAAARAAQRRFRASVDILREAVENCGVKDFLKAKSTALINGTQFEQFHRAWCASIVEFLERKDVPDVTYGRAAKLIAVYLKSMVVLGPNSNTDLARVAHPPIDRTLLQEMSRSPEINSPYKARWRSVNWTELGERDYYQLLSELKESLSDGEPFWTLERFWAVADE